MAALLRVASCHACCLPSERCACRYIEMLRELTSSRKRISAVATQICSETSCAVELQGCHSIGAMVKAQPFIDSQDKLTAVDACNKGPTREFPVVVLPNQCGVLQKFDLHHFEELRKIDAFVTNLTVYFLEDDIVNPHKGSVPVERLQAKVRQHLTDAARPELNALYARLIGPDGPPTTMYVSWKQFVKSHKQEFDYIEVPGRNGSREGRLRLPKHRCNRDADANEKRQRCLREEHLRSCLSEFVALCNNENRTATMDSFLNEWDQLCTNTQNNYSGKKPHRGDLKRFLVRSPEFTYKEEGNVISACLNSALFDGSRFTELPCQDSPNIVLHPTNMTARSPIVFPSQAKLW
eukprot:TRINITY_DN6844_c0_g2_i1.p1 TRINITY_DN6844_c0_g2~~TRINITY_DN6844_c0_g2_i1.p1  ORF type:complete len:351 (+),score=19.76 TRINITY_DN6844_c0_g2_i1:69-1121(+)